MATEMDVDTTLTPGSESVEEVRKRFEVKKVRLRDIAVAVYADYSQWNAVALWAWDIVVDNCAICRNHIMDLCKRRN